jgi:replicative DNA helicase
MDNVKLFDEGAEMAILGCILLEPDRTMFSLNELKFTAGMFYLRHHQIIYMTILSLATKHVPIEVMTVAERLRSKGNASKVGDVAYLNKLIDATPTALHAEYYAGVVVEKYRLRFLVGCCKSVEDCIGQGQTSEEIGATMMANIMAQMDAVPAGNPKSMHDQSMLNAKTAHDGGQRPGWPSFLAPINHFIGSYVPGQVYVIAGMPSNGKTSWTVCEIIHKAVELNVPCAFISMEMSEQTIRQNMAATLAGIDAFKFFMLGKYNDFEADAIKDAFDRLLKAPVYIADRRMTIEQIVSWLAFMVKKHGIRFVGLDYLQLIRFSAGQQQLSRNEQVMAWSSTLKESARRFNIALLLVSQLSRAGIKSRELTPPPPALEALRDSGSIEQDADVVIFIYKKPGEPYENFVTNWEMEVDVAKSRGTPIGAVKAVFRRNRQSFVTLEDFEIANQQQLKLGTDNGKQKDKPY